MSSIRVSTIIDAPPARVWQAVEDLASHVVWMHDAVAIRLTSERHRGVGTTFECDTRIGPLRTTDHMEITEWVDGQAMGVRHVGAVTGTGRFTLRPVDSGTEFAWEERLTFPWWMGGALGGALGAPVLRWVWRRNLRDLKALVERG